MIGGQRPPDRIALVAVIERGIEQQAGRIIEIGPLQQRQRRAGQQLRIVAPPDDRLIVQDLACDRLGDLLIGIVPGLDVLDGMVVERLELPGCDDLADLSGSCGSIGQFHGRVHHDPVVMADFDQSLDADLRRTARQRIGDGFDISHIVGARAGVQFRHRLDGAGREIEPQEIDRVSVHSLVAVFGVHRVGPGRHQRFRRTRLVLEIDRNPTAERRQHRRQIERETGTHIEYTVDVGGRLIDPV